MRAVLPLLSLLAACGGLTPLAPPDRDEGGDDGFGFEDDDTGPSFSELRSSSNGDEGTLVQQLDCGAGEADWAQHPGLQGRWLAHRLASDPR